jgi:hypothetical protein
MLLGSLYRTIWGTPMCRVDWIAIHTSGDPYGARSALERYDNLRPYLAQKKVPWGEGKVKLTPVFRSILLVRESESGSPALQFVRGLRILPCRLFGAEVTRLLLFEWLAELDDAQGFARRADERTADRSLAPGSARFVGGLSANFAAAVRALDRRPTRVSERVAA